MIWNEAMETMPRAEIEKLQSERLRQLVSRVYEKVPFYRQKFNELAHNAFVFCWNSSAIIGIFQ